MSNVGGDGGGAAKMGRGGVESGVGVMTAGELFVKSIISQFEGVLVTNEESEQNLRNCNQCRRPMIRRPDRVM